MALPNLLQQPISETYKGLLHTSNVPIEENTLAVVYDGKGNKSSMKLGKENNGVEFSGKVKATDFSIRDFTTIVDYLYPKGAIYLSTTDTNPGSRFLGTSWEKVSEGKFLVGVANNALDANSKTKSFSVGNNNGNYENTLTTNQMPSHTHTGINVIAAAGSTASTYSSGKTTALDRQVVIKHETGGHSVTKTTDVNITLHKDGLVILDPTGGGQPIENTPPSYGVYIFKRIA